MTAPCDTCGRDTEPETSLALADGFRCKACPPKVEFFPERICANHKRCTPGSNNCAGGACSDRHYKIDGERTVKGQDIVSVTTVTKEIGDTFGQGAWWGQRTGIEGALVLAERGFLALDAGKPSQDLADPVVSLLTKHKLTTNHVRDDAAKRGTDVHDAAEKWATSGNPPKRADYPTEQQGFIKALLSFIRTEKPEPLGAEILVGSRKGAYAGTFDLLARFPRLDAIGVIDFKTKSKPPKGKPVAYEQHHLQIRGYEDARVEMGHDPSDFQCVVNLYPDGTYALIQGQATSQQWQDALGAYRSLTSLRTSIKEAA